MITMPGKSFRGTLPELTREEVALRDRLREHVTVLATTIGERSTARPEGLEKAAAYISRHLKEYGYDVREEPYEVNRRNFVNVVAELQGAVRRDEIVVVGAHYDSVFGTAGANDNASGVAALLEIARVFQGKHWQRTIRFVAFVNEEPPWFQTDLMGSLIHAREAKRRGERIVAMYSLETIGSYYDTPGSQKYPPPLNLFFPDTGNFIGFVSNTASRELLQRSIETFRETTKFPSEGVAAPEFITGVGWSDQWAFWQEGFPAIMITDTAPFRYPHYHQKSDTPDKLDYSRMARVTAGIGRVVEREAGR